MSNKMENKLVPKLRFPEFIGETGWQEKPIKTLAEKVIKKNQKLAITTVFTNSAIGGIVNQRDYFEKDIANQEGLQNYYVVSPGDYVYNPRISKEAPVGPISKNNTGKVGVMSPLYTVFRFFEENNGFYEYYFKTNHWFKAIRKAANTGARFDRMSINDSAFMDILVQYPKPEEQQKIASCLSSLDDLITAENEKLEALKNHKKGLMQQLFPSEGEKVPKLRFPEFKDSEKWQEKNFGDILVESRLGGNFENIESLVGIPVIKMGNIGRGVINLEKIQYLPFNGTHDEEDILKQGDLLFNTRNALDLVGKVAIWRNELPFALYNSNLLRLKFKEEIIASNYFMNFLLNTPSFIRKLRQIATGTTSVAAIYGKDLNRLKLIVPLLDEQEKIVKCLSSIDEQIAIQMQKNIELKLHKSGLMQGLFPTID